MDPSVYLGRIVGTLPLFVVWAVGLRLCWTKRQRWPASSWVLMAIVLALATKTLIPLLSVWIFQTFLTGLSAVGVRAALDSLLTSVAEAVVWGLLLWAIFGQAPRSVRRNR